MNNVNTLPEELKTKILNFMIETGKTDSNSIQREFKISYHNYCLFVDWAVEKGYLSSKLTRQILPKATNPD